MLDAKELYQALLDAYGTPRWWSDNPFTVMFQAVLVQNTTWNSVKRVSAEIGDKLMPQYIGSLQTEELEQLIAPCGFYKAKARTIQALILWFERYGFARQAVQSIPMSIIRKELLEIRGIGAETADVILVYAFYQTSFIIDAYTRRFLSRRGYFFPNDQAIRQFFEKDLPREARLYGYYHWLILDHCISVCKKMPNCGACRLRPGCKRIV